MDSSRRNRKFGNRNHSRRYILRTVTTLAVALALGWAAAIQTAKAQQQPADAGRHARRTSL